MPAPVERIRVLLIEDDREDYLIARELLANARQSRFDLQWAPTLAEGARLAREQADVILLDLSLPDSHGWDTFHKLRAQIPDVPIILLTGLSDEDLGVRAVQEGAEDYLVKGRLDGALLQRTLRYAIERNKLREELKQVADALRVRTEQMANDLVLARDVQQSMLQRQYPAFPADGGRLAALRFSHVYLPSRFVSGDFFHILSISATEAGIFIGDVMGHGVRSALVGAILRGLLEEMKPVARNPAELLTALNRAMMGILQVPGQLIFASAFYVVIDVSTGVARFSNAGHPVPIYNRVATGETLELPIPLQQIGPALGIQREPGYVTVETALCAGDTLLINTDGVCEAKNEADQEYGHERLLACMRRGLGLSVDELLALVMEDLKAYCGDREFEDDVCLVGIRYLPAGAS